MAKKLVLLVHGIRTRAQWQDVAKKVLSDIPDCEVVPIGYGFLDVLRFWFPFFTRNKPIRDIKEQISGLTAQYPKDTEITVIAHSFGTYAVTQILEQSSYIHIDNLVLCGSIVSGDYDWAKADNQVRNKIVNDHGSKDVWPPFARAISWFYGATGTYGTKKFQVRDRKHPFQHSDYFSPKFINQFWRPVIVNGEVVKTDYRDDEMHNPFWFYIFEFPLKWLLLIGMLFGLNYMFPEVQNKTVVQTHAFISAHPQLAAVHKRLQRPGCLRLPQLSNRQFCAKPNDRLKTVDQGGEGLVIRSGPSTACAGVIGRDLFPGELIEVQEVHLKWYYIKKLQNDGQASATEGWAHRGYLDEVECPVVQ